MPALKLCDTDYVSRFKLDYPVVYIHPGVRESYQPMYCLSPPSVNKAVTVVCDWAAPPQVQFTLGDDYMHVMRQDPTGRYQGNAIITTYQLCGHNISHVDTFENKPAITPRMT
ncbi:jg20340 [Pararge aegeria aegeria]|uniref:Jg20340 protein n=1 Tax=Pararge aegeria aegeria TaxID=348720 RepID=A0A8S4RAP6_9NEOP|nr:jg20340 [Pararge aegeria aegeria]